MLKTQFHPIYSGKPGEVLDGAFRVVIVKGQRAVELTAGFAPPPREENPFGSTGPHIAGKGSTHAVLALLTVTRVKHAVLGTEGDI